GVAVPITLGGFEIIIAQTVRLPAPGDRTPSHVASADPPERLVLGSRVRIVDVIYEQVMPILVRRITPRLNRLARGVFRSGNEIAIFQLVRESVLLEILLRVKLASRLKNEHGHSALR